MKTLFAVLTTFALCAPLATAQDAASLENPIKAVKLGTVGVFSYKLSSPYRTEVGRLHVELRSRTTEQYQVHEKLVFGSGAWTKKLTAYKLEGRMLDQIKAQYARQFTNLKITSTKVVGNIVIALGAQKHQCQRLIVQFDAVNQTRKVKGDLYFTLCPGVGPLGILVFRSIVTYETSPGRFNLTQTLEMRLQAPAQD